jgi:predicted dehydrogenase
MPSPRIAIIGLGNHGRLLTDYLIEEDVEIIGVDASASLRNTFESSYDVDTHSKFDIVQELDFDGVIVTLPNSLHEEMVIQALEYDIDVLVEKPLATSVSAIERIDRAQQQSEAVCLVDLYHRSVPESRILRHHISSGELGEIEFVHGQFNRRQGVPAEGSWLTSKEIAGGGVLMDLGIHSLDLILWLLGFPEVGDISGNLKGRHRKHQWTELEEYETDRELGADMFDVEDSAVVTFHTESGTQVLLETAWASGQPNRHQYRVQGTDGAAGLDITGLAENPELQIFHTETEPVNHYVDRNIQLPGQENPQRSMLKHFLEITQGNGQTAQAFDEYTNVHRIIEEVYEQEPEF